MTVEFDPRLNEAQKRLAMLVVKKCEGRDMNARLLREIQHLADDFGMTCRLKGIDFPKLVVLPLPNLSQIVIWPKEASFQDIQVRIKQLIVQMRRVEKEVNHEELAAAIKMAYPDYGPMMGNFMADFAASEPARLPIYDN